ncbi:MAG: hypothetical protein BJG00_000960 [Limnothrix sp. CACIAM 69d]|nr:MAG: hypothetical protein BJG00_000960 [Limnothrix sp. CACIAM 69d]
MSFGDWPVSLHGRFEGALVGGLVALHQLDRTWERDRRNLDAALQGALQLSEIVGAQAGPDPGLLALASLEPLMAGPGDQLGLALLPLLLRWFDRPLVLRQLWTQAMDQPLPEAVILGAEVLAWVLVHPNAATLEFSQGDREETEFDPAATHATHSAALSNALWPSVVNILSDWQTLDRLALDWPQRLRAATPETLPILVALHSLRSSGGRWASSLARCQQQSASAVLWSGVLVGAVGGCAAIPADVGAIVPDRLLTRTIQGSQMLIDRWSGRLPQYPLADSIAEGDRLITHFRVGR